MKRVEASIRVPCFGLEVSGVYQCLGHILEVLGILFGLLLDKISALDLALNDEGMVTCTKSCILMMSV